MRVRSFFSYKLWWQGILILKLVHSCTTGLGARSRRVCEAVHSKVLSPHFNISRLTLIIYLTGIVTIAYSVTGVFLAIFRCNPVAKTWDVTITQGSCLSQMFESIFLRIIACVTTTITFLLPIPLTWVLHVPRRQKAMVVLILMASSLLVSTSLVYLSHILIIPGQGCCRHLPTIRICF